MLYGARPVRYFAFAVALAALGCHAQTPGQAAANSTPVQVGVKLSPELTRRIEVMIRSRSDLPLDATISIGAPVKTDFAGFDQVDIAFAASDGKTSHSTPFLLSADGKTLAQMNKFDLSQDPRDKITVAGRPARGGPPNAPVQVVVFDDLECPFCAQTNDDLVPAILKRYKDQVRVIYRDLPLEDLHPWAMHAAVDANCLAAASTEGYWNFVDYVHVHANDIAGTEKTPAKANQNLDKIALDEGARRKVNQAELTVCMQNQDTTKIKASVVEAAAAGIDTNQTPLLYVNGEKIEGVVPLNTLYKVIDRALIAAGQTPPPPAPPAPAPAAAKPGS